MTYLKKNSVRLASLILVVVIAGCSHSSNLRETNDQALCQTIRENVLRVQKSKLGSVEKLGFYSAITENSGTAKEEQCLCQAVCFRVAQLATQAWCDGVFRSYGIKKIRTGWNTDGPYEFYSDQQYHGEFGDLGISITKIQIEKQNGNKATPGNQLTMDDLWYEITFSNNTKMFFSSVDGPRGIFPTGFLALRSQIKKGNVENIKQFK